MAARHPLPGRGADEGRAPHAPSVPTSHSMAGARPLGDALHARAAFVLSETVARTIDSGDVVDALVQESFERICNRSTVAVAEWIAGEGLEASRDAGRETWEIFGELAA